MPIPNQELTRVFGSQGVVASPAAQVQAAPPAQAQPTSTRLPANTVPPPGSPTPSTLPPTRTPAPPTATSSPTITPPPTEDVVRIAVGYVMDDGASLLGTLYRPTSGDRDLPGVILLPMYVETRQVWEPFARQLARRGFAVLTLDLRGQGESSGPPDWVRSIQDVRQVARTFADRQEVDGERLAVVGASNAANIALNAAADEPGIRTLILLSPGLNYRGIAANDALAKLEGRQIYVLASEADTIAGDWPFRMQEMARDRVFLRAYPGDAHGSFLLTAQPGVLNEMARWLNDELVEQKVVEAPAPRRSFTPVLLFCLCVLVAAGLLVLAAGLAASLVRQTRFQSRPLIAAELQPGTARLEVRGRAGRLSAGRDAAAPAPRLGPLAVRLLVQAVGPGGALETRHDQVRVQPFALVDESGSMVIIPAESGVRLDAGDAGLPGDSGLPGGVRLSREQASHWLSVFGLQELLTQPEVLHFTLWELADGASAGAVGRVSSLPHLRAWRAGAHSPPRQPIASSALRALSRPVLLRGRLAEVFDPLDADLVRPLALRRRVVEENDPQYGWVVLFEDAHASPFRLEDGYGSAWVELDTDRLELDTQPVERPIDEFRLLLGDAAVPESSTDRARRYLVYELRAGDEIWVGGELAGQKLLFNAEVLTLRPSGPPLQPIAALTPGSGRVRVAGKILEVDLPPGSRPGFSEASTAWLRLLVEQPSAAGWEPILDARLGHPFRLEDATGSLWVDPADAAPDAFGVGLSLSEQQADAYLARLRRSLPAGAGMDLRFTAWEHRVGAVAEVSGVVVERRSLSGVPQPVLSLSNPRPGTADRLRSWIPLLRSRAQATRQ